MRNRRFQTTFRSTEQAVAFIKDLLGAPEKWVIHTMFSTMSIHMHRVDKKKLQKEIFEWLKRRI